MVLSPFAPQCHPSGPQVLGEHSLALGPRAQGRRAPVRAGGPRSWAESGLALGLSTVRLCGAGSFAGAGGSDSRGHTPGSGRSGTRAVTTPVSPFLSLCPLPLSWARDLRSLTRPPGVCSPAGPSQGLPPVPGWMQWGPRWPWAPGCWVVTGPLPPTMCLCLLVTWPTGRTLVPSRWPMSSRHVPGGQLSVRTSRASVCPGWGAGGPGQCGVCSRPHLDLVLPAERGHQAAEGPPDLPGVRQR